MERGRAQMIALVAKYADEGKELEGVDAEEADAEEPSSLKHAALTPPESPVELENGGISQQLLQDIRRPQTVADEKDAPPEQQQQQQPSARQLSSPLIALNITVQPQRFVAWIKQQPVATEATRSSSPPTTQNVAVKPQKIETFWAPKLISPAATLQRQQQATYARSKTTTSQSRQQQATFTGVNAKRASAAWLKPDNTWVLQQFKKSQFMSATQASGMLQLSANPTMPRQELNTYLRPIS